MAKVLEERVEVAAIKSDYKYGFHDPDQSVFRARKGLDRGIVDRAAGLRRMEGPARAVRIEPHGQAPGADDLREGVQAWSSAVSRDGLSIADAELGDDSGIIGAGLLAGG